MDNPKIKFFGGVGSTTGANIMLEFNQRKILIDCGLLQGTKQSEEKNFEPFEYNPAGASFLLITHAHLDHIGKVPKLVREGFGGKIISTKETLELAKPVLEDAISVMKAKHPGKILFDENDLEKALSLWQGFDYGEKIELFSGCNMEMQNAGHILGSAIINVFCGDKKISFTGDLGNSPSPLLPDAEFIKNADYVVMESVYGDRNHESREEGRRKLKEGILDGIKKDGTIIIPTFSIEKTQVLLYEINNMIEEKETTRLTGGQAQIPVFLDSPLAIKVTDIYKKYEKDFKKSVKDEIKKGDDIFDFPGLNIVRTAEESAQIEKTKGAKIILAGSGMSEGGRVVNHEMNYLPDPNAIIILVGYQAIGTLGRLLEDGAKEIASLLTPPRRGGEPEKDNFSASNEKKIKVSAQIKTIKGYSSHMDSEHLVEFVEKANEINSVHKLKRVFVIMGEPKSSLFLCQRLRDYLDVNAIYPEESREYEL